MQGLETDSATIVRSPRRFEVITGDSMRRAHADGFKGRLVALTLTPGACIAQIARAHDIHPQMLYTWRRQAKAGKLALPAVETPAFAPVVIDDEPPAGGSAALEPSEVAAILIEIGGVTVRLPGEIAAARLAQIAAALREAL